MADIRRYSKTATGKWQKLPWNRRLNTPSPKMLTPPTIIGTPAPGQRLTWAGGTYEGIEIQSEGGEWTLYDTSGAVLRQSSNPSFTIPVEAPSGRLEIVEHAVDKYRRRPEPPGKASVAVTAVTGLPVFTRDPVISVSGGGAPVVGAVLVAVRGAATGSPAPTIAGEWYRGGTATGVTALSYTTTPADLAAEMTYLDTANSGGNQATARSNRITVVSATQTIPAFTAKPSIARNTTTGVLTATPAPVVGSPPPTVTGQWYIASSATGALAAIPGATGATWTPTALYFGGGYYASFRNSATNTAGGPILSEYADRVPIPATEGFTAQPVVTPSKAADWYPSARVSTTDGTYRGTPTRKIYEWTVDGVVSSVLTDYYFDLSNQSPGKKIKSRVGLVYASGNTVYSSYSAEITVSNRPTTGDEGDADYTVTTAAGLRTALINASLGQVIEMAPGDYGQLDLRNISKNTSRTGMSDRSSFVRIRPQDRVNMPRVNHRGTKVLMTDTSGILIDGIFFDGSSYPDTRANGDPYPAARANSDIISQNYPNGARVADTGSKGMRLENSIRHVRIENCLFKFHHRQIECAWNCIAYDLWIRGNEFIEDGMDTVNFIGNMYGCRFQYNLIWRTHIDYKRTSEINILKGLYRPGLLRHPIATMRPRASCPSGRVGTGLASGGRGARSASIRCRFA
ncbi:hypothetical protein [Sphingomonas sp.]|uniref:hypothetical protein n=1 Tax=Sphingomonas sp. TaxID=28214 RepID=UPI003FA78E97